MLYLFFCFDLATDGSFTHDFILKIVKPRPQTLSPKTQKPKTEGPWDITKISWATTPPHPKTFEHDGRVPHKKSKSKKGSE